MAFTGDNATSNDTQTASLAINPNNTFEEPNRVRCFNHTLNLAVKSLLKPFGSEKKSQSGDNNDGDNDSDDSDDDGDSDTLGISDNSELVLEIPEPDDEPVEYDGDEVDNGNVDEFDRLNEIERAEMLGNTEEVRTVIAKVCMRIASLR